MMRKRVVHFPYLTATTPPYPLRAKITRIAPGLERFLCFHNPLTPHPRHGSSPQKARLHHYAKRCGQGEQEEGDHFFSSSAGALSFASASLKA